MNNSSLGRTPPQNIEAEQASLGAILLNPKDIVMDEVIGTLSPEDFYHNAHNKIYKSILNLSSRGEPIDLITLTDELQSQKQLSAVGGSSYISSLTSIVPTSSNVLHYANIVKETSLRRSILNLASELSEEAYNEAREINNIVDEAESKIFDITQSHFKGSYKHVKPVVSDVIDLIEKRQKNPDELSGIPSGFTQLDSLTDGFQDSEFIVIGARPSIGKTAFALTIIRNMCIRRKIETGFFSLEMADEQLMHRLISMETRIPADYLRKGKLNQNAMHTLVTSAADIYDAPLYICDTPNMRLIDLKAQSRRMKAAQDIKIIFIDYLSIITTENEMRDRHLQVAELSRNLKSLARELKIPIVALSQLSRDSEGKVPHLASIRESGAIEQDADLVLFLHRDRTKDNVSDDVDTQLIVAKNRNGPVGQIDISFLPKYAEFVVLDTHAPKEAS